MYCDGSSIGNTRDIQLPQQLPQHEYLEQMEPLGIIHTVSGNEPPYMTAMDVTQHARLMNAHKSWDKKTVSMTVSFTPGSVSLASWASHLKDISGVQRTRT